MTLYEMRERLNVDSLSESAADELEKAALSDAFPVEWRGWAFECIQILRSLPLDA